MKKIISFAFVILFFPPASSVEWSLKAPCSDDVHYYGDVSAPSGSTAGDITITALTQSGIEFIGNKYGMNSILGTPTGNDAIVIVSKTEMRAYGWCYAVNGIVSDTLRPNQVEVSDSDHVSWFYAYAWYDKEWKEMCVPAHLNPPKFCKKGSKK